MTEQGSTKFQFVAAAAANLSSLVAGTVLGWISAAVFKLEIDLNDSPLGRRTTVDEIVWIGSLVYLGAMAGCFLAAYLAERFGRKTALLSSVVPSMLGWILIASAKNVGQIYAARLILGIGISFAFTVVPMYCGEIAETSVRGALGSFLQLFIIIGQFSVSHIGPYVSYVVISILCAIVPVIFFGCFLMMPESPYFLLKVGKREEAINALARLRSKSPASVQQEADEIQAVVKEAFRNEAKISGLFTVKSNSKALMCTCLLVFFQQLIAVNVVFKYTYIIFINAGIHLSSAVANIIGVVPIIASVVMALIADRFGRKVLLLFSAAGWTISLVTLGIYMYQTDGLHSDGSNSLVLPVICLVILIFTYYVGWGPVPWMMMGEMFAPNVKSKASGITVCFCWLVAFLIAEFNSNFQAVFDNYDVYHMYAVLCLVSMLFVVHMLPETKGNSFQKIQDKLNGGSPSTLESGDSSE